MSYAIHEEPLFRTLQVMDVTELAARVTESLTDSSVPVHLGSYQPKA